MKAFRILTPLALTLSLAACAPTPAQQRPAPEQPVSQGRIIPVTAALWQFTPNVIRARQGESVTLQVTGISGTHGFSVPALGIEQPIFAGMTAMIPLPTNQAGTFDFACSVQCGSGHNAMRGQIIIE